ADPKDTDILLGRGRSKFELTYFEGSIYDFTLALEINDKLISAYYYRGLSLYEVRRYEESLVDFEKVQELLDLTADMATLDYYKNLLMHLGNCQRMLKKYDIALKLYDKAIDKDPDNPELYYNRANAKYSMTK